MFYVPLIRTLSMQGKETVKKAKTIVNMTDDGPEYVAVEAEIPAERALKYVPIGNYKWCVPSLLVMIQ